MTLAELRRLAEAVRLEQEPPVEAIETASDHLPGEPPVRRAAHEVLVAAARADPSEASRAVAAVVTAYEWNDRTGVPGSAVLTLRTLAVLRPRAFMGNVEPLVRAASDGMGDADPAVTGLLAALAHRVPSILTRAVAWHVAHAEEGIYQGDGGYRLVGIAGATAPTAARPTVAAAVEALDGTDGERPDPESLRRALETLRVVGTVLPALVPDVEPIVARLSHDDAEVREEAAETLATVARDREGQLPFQEPTTDRVVSALAVAAEDPVDEVRQAAYEALGRVGAAEPRLAAAAWAPLLRALHDETYHPQEQSVAAVELARLAAVRGPERRQELLTELTDALLERPSLWGAVERAVALWRERVEDWSLAAVPLDLRTRLVRYLLGLPHWEVWDADAREPLVSFCCSIPEPVFEPLDTAALAHREARVLRQEPGHPHRTAALAVLSVLGRVDEHAASVTVGQVLTAFQGEDPESPAEYVVALERVATGAATASARESAVAALTTTLDRTSEESPRNRLSEALQTLVEQDPTMAPVVVERFCSRQRGPAMGDAPAAFRAATLAAPAALEPALFDLLGVAAGAPPPGATADEDDETAEDSAEESMSLGELFGDGEADEGPDTGSPVAPRREAARAVLAGVAAVPETPVIGPAEIKPFLWQPDHDDSVVAALAGALAIRADHFDTRRYAVERLRTLLARETTVACPREATAGSDVVVDASRALVAVAEHDADAVAPAVRTLAACEATATQRALARIAIADPRYLSEALARLRTPDDGVGTGGADASDAARHRDPLAALWLLAAYPALAPALVPTLAARCRAPDPPDNPVPTVHHASPVPGPSYRHRVNDGVPDERAFERTVVEALAEVPGAAATEYLERARSVPDPDTRATARRALDDRPVHDATGTTGAAPDTDPGAVPAVRAVTRPLATPAESADSDRLESAAKGLDVVGAATAADPEVRRAAATALGFVGHRAPADAAGAVCGLLDDSDPVVVAHAARAAGELARVVPDAVGPLDPALRAATGGPPATDEAVVTALGRVGIATDGTESVDALVERLWDPSPGVRRRAAAALARVVRHDETAASDAAPALERRFLTDPDTRWTLAVALLAVPSAAVESPERLATGLVGALAGYDDGAADGDGSEEVAGAAADATHGLARPLDPERPDGEVGRVSAGHLLERLARTDPDAVRVAFHELPAEIDWEDRLSGPAHPVRRTLPALATLTTTLPTLCVPGEASLDHLLDETTVTNRWLQLGARVLARTGTSLHLAHLEEESADREVAADVARYLVHTERGARDEATATVAESALDTCEAALAVREMYDDGRHREGAIAALRGLVEADGDAVAEVAATPVRRELTATGWERRVDAVTAIPPLVQAGGLDPDAAAGLLFRRLEDDVMRVRRAAGTALATVARETRAGVRCVVALLAYRLRVGADHGPHGELRALGVLGARHRFVRADCREALTAAADRLDTPLDEFAEAALDVLRGRADPEAA
ncbi:HEAT repeat domain-containing protein [Haloglomus salinum]|uniref:HEAT repeat domain-containing protein n=1 Tax=Haloglomus salinum TaxID=2962673 RepID=UPI0020CA0903|nr:HEAT repeat domain-containing protein [Haloglomus salinum]